MKTRHFLAATILLLTAAVLPAQDQSFFFIQMADTQFGFFNGDKSHEQETANLEFTVANINRLRPAFVVVCGDLVNKPGDRAQIDEYIRIMGKLDKSIPLYNVSGNHDLENEPTPQTLAAYREKFGRDYYSFRSGDLAGIVLNSTIIHTPAKVADEVAAQEKWLREELARLKAAGPRHLVVFQHHSWFVEKADEPDQYFNIPLERRRVYLEMFKAAGVSHIFAGHLHRNAAGKDGTMEMTTTGPVGRPLGADPSGFRVVLVRPAGIEHRYYGLGSIPFAVQLTPPPAKKK